MIDCRIRAKWLRFGETVVDERIKTADFRSVENLMGLLWNEHFCWRQGFRLTLYVLQGAPRRWVRRMIIDWPD